MPGGARRFLPTLGVAVLFALPLLPEILGTKRLVFRDAQVTHWPWRRAAMAAVSAGDVPFVNAAASGGQPLLANPNAALLYPTMFLEKVLSPAAAFNLHYLVHVLWAFAGARALARRLGLSAGPAFFSGIAFGFSGMLLSYASGFLNSSAAASWMPWCAAAVVDLVRSDTPRGRARAAAAAAIAFGLQVLAGEPALSLVTALFALFLAAGELLFEAREGRGLVARSRGLLIAGASAAAGAAAFAAPLLLPLSAVFRLTYRGQHLYSERAFGASPFALWRAVEWLFPRFDGDPGALGASAHWQYALHPGDLVYIWRVTFGVIPLLAVAAASLRREFWCRRAVWLAAGAIASLLFAFGTALPFSRLLYAIALFRRLRYPIKFYLLTTLCVALLSGFALELWKRRRGRGRELVLLAAAALVYVASYLAAGAGGALDRAVTPLVKGLAAPAASLLPAIRESFRADALLGIAAVLALGLVLSLRPPKGGAHALAFATLLLALPWGLPLFVSADEKDLARPPAVLRAIHGPGRVYISPRLPEFNVLATGTAHPRLPPSVSRLARIQIEELIPSTGSPFGVRYLFDSDPDGSYGFYNRLAGEALAVSSPAEQARLLRAFGARWILADEGFALPQLLPLTGFEIAGRRLVLSELAGAMPELRWAGRAFRRPSLSAALDLVRSDAFQPETDVVLPGSRGEAGPATAPARVTPESIASDRAAARVDAASPGHIVFSRTFFSVWRARVDGRPVPLLVGNARDLAVPVPAGSHHVEFEYDRTPFRAGVALQIAAFLAIAGALAVHKGPFEKSQRRSRSDRPR